MTSTVAAASSPTWLTERSVLTLTPNSTATTRTGITV
jgi:hypothetical protein